MRDFLGGELGPSGRAGSKARERKPRISSASGGVCSLVSIVDARSAAEYWGEKMPQNGGRAGHIPTARLLDLYDLVDADGRFPGADVQREQLAKAGIAPDRPIIVYSHGGNRSAGVIFALRRLGIPARHYIGGLSDWASDPSAPVVEGAEAGRRAE